MKTCSARKTPWFILWAAYRWTGDKKYILPVRRRSRRTPSAPSTPTRSTCSNVRDTWGKQRAADHQPLTAATTPPPPAKPITAARLAADRRYQDTSTRSTPRRSRPRRIASSSTREGSLWIDRIYFNNGELQRSRLGGVALMRNYDYPGNVVSWHFASASRQRSRASPSSSRKARPTTSKSSPTTSIPSPSQRSMTGWEIDPGKWEITQGIQGSSPNCSIAQNVEHPHRRLRTQPRVSTSPLPPHTTTVIELKLSRRASPTGRDLTSASMKTTSKVEGNRIKVTVHSLGSVNTPASKVVLRDKTGKVLASASVPSIKAPLDLFPKTSAVALVLPSGADYKGGSITVETSSDIPEITQMNNRVPL